MKRIVLIFAAFLAAFGLGAQTPAEIVKRMDAALDKAEENGTAFTFIMDIPILGKASTRVYSLGDKVKMEIEMMGEVNEAWIDGNTSWIYDKKNNELVASTIKKSDDAAADAMSAFQDITDGYDVSLEKETNDTWYLLCKKSRKNKDKDAAKKINIAVSKGSYMPVYLHTKAKGIGMSIENIKPGVDPEVVAFSPDKFPGAKIKDQRK